MPGWDDPRYVQQQFEKLQRDIKALQTTTLPFAVHQKGAIPGFMRAVQIGDANQKSAMWIDLVGNTPGQAPYLAVTDANGTVRVELGNLTANGSSPAQFGIRVNDATGSPIFDSVGLFGNRVMQSLGITDVTNLTFNSTTFATVTGSSISFTIPANHPPANILALFIGTGQVATNNGNVGFLRANYDNGTQTSGNENFGVLANFAQTSSGFLFVTGAAAGSHTIRLDAAVNATPQTFTLIEAALQVYQLGG